MKAVQVKIDNRYILYDAGCIENPASFGFDADYWASRDAIIGYAEGRGTTFFIQYNTTGLNCQNKVYNTAFTILHVSVTPPLMANRKLIMGPWGY